MTTTNDQWTDEQLDEALAVRFDSDAGDDLTLAEWLQRLLLKVWKEQEGFSGKRPFGNSGWEWDPYLPLVKAGLLQGQLDAGGRLDDVDGRQGEALVRAAIVRLTSRGPRLDQTPAVTDPGDPMALGTGTPEEGNRQLALDLAVQLNTARAKAGAGPIVCEVDKVTRAADTLLAWLEAEPIPQETP